MHDEIKWIESIDKLCSCGVKLKNIETLYANEVGDRQKACSFGAKLSLMKQNVFCGDTSTRTLYIRKKLYINVKKAMKCDYIMYGMYAEVWSSHRTGIANVRVYGKYPFHLSTTLFYPMIN